MVLGTALVFNIANGAVNLGRQQGYAPEQPIKFSHELHAGQLKIDCQFCHSGARKGKHANIPAVNVCMSCHKYVQEGPKYGTKEIDKIYAAAGWDPEEQAYTSPQQPIKWVRIHNLPDHVYFNHAQHVAVGGVDCQTCHGPVETMEVLAQFAPSAWDGASIVTARQMCSSLPIITIPFLISTTRNSRRAAKWG